jgi:DHHC palmitoyltransferase
MAVVDRLIVVGVTALILTLAWSAQSVARGHRCARVGTSGTSGAAAVSADDGIAPPRSLADAVSPLVESNEAILMRQEESGHTVTSASLIFFCVLIIWSLLSAHLRGAGAPPSESLLRAAVDTLDGSLYFPPRKTQLPECEEETVYGRSLARAKAAVSRGIELFGRLPRGRGRRDEETAPSVEDAVNPIHWCDRGCGPVPLRAYHCRTCRSCRLKLEHHCFFIGACVGHQNHKAFVLFLVYAVVGLSIACLTFASHFFGSAAAEEDMARCQPLLPAPWVLWVSFVVSFALVLALCRILLFQVNVVSTNTTSIERSHRRWRERDGFAWPYDLGWRGNWSELVGRNPALWFLPTGPDTNGVLWDGYDKYLSLESLSLAV